MANSTDITHFIAQAGGGGGLSGIIFPMLLFFGAMYFFMIAPQRKKEKEHKKMLSELKAGDKVVTIGGIFGTITAVKEDRFHLKVDDSTRLEILKTSVQSRRAEESQ